MLSKDEIVKRLQDRNLSKVAEAVGLTRAAVSKIARGDSVKPSHDLIEKLSTYLECEHESRYNNV